MEEHKFIQALEQTLLTEKNVSITENGAIGYHTSGKALLDLNFAVSSMRNMDEEEIKKLFVKAFYEDRELAIRWLFFVSDIREGMGERRLLRILLKYLAETHKEAVREIISLVPEYSRWDNLWCLLDTELKDDVLKLVKEQLLTDENSMVAETSASLLAKWMPSLNTSSEKSRSLAVKMAEGLGMSKAEYRKCLSSLRAYLKVVEVYMSKNAWEEIIYENVPSRANLIYKKAFFRHGREQRIQYLEQVKNGEKKINSQVLFPHDIVHRYKAQHGWCEKIKEETDDTLEALWNALPDYVNGGANTICVVDGSGSMTQTIGKSQVACSDVANALAIYFSERAKGIFQDTFITFSKTPQLISVKSGKTLREKLEILNAYQEVANTNIEAVFELLLLAAVRGNLAQEEMPENILILSDMEFDGCTVDMNGERCSVHLFETIRQRYLRSGYKLPRLIFWNICSRSRTIPLMENEMGVTLLSGFSSTIMDMVLSTETDPFVCLKKKLESSRYDAVGQAIAEVL